MKTYLEVNTMGVHNAETKHFIADSQDPQKLEEQLRKTVSEYLDNHPEDDKPSFGWKGALSNIPDENWKENGLTPTEQSMSEPMKTVVLNMPENEILFGGMGATKDKDAIPVEKIAELVKMGVSSERISPEVAHKMLGNILAKLKEEPKHDDRNVKPWEPTSAEKKAPTKEKESSEPEH